MASPKVAIIYYSATGNVHKLAQAAAEGAKSAGAEVRVRRVPELAPEAAIASNAQWKAFHESVKNEPVATLADLEWADAYILGTPTRYGTIASQLKQFIDTTGGLWSQGKLSNKPAAALVSAGNPHGGQESTVLSLFHVFSHWGSLIVPPGYTDALIYAAGGNPYGASSTGSEQGPTAEELQAARYLGTRVATVATWVLAGKQDQVPAIR